MLRVNENVYVDQNGTKYIQIRNEGYDLFAYLNADEKTYGYCGGFVGPMAGWREILPVDQVKEDVEFKDKIETVPLYSSFGGSTS